MCIATASIKSVWGGLGISASASNPPITIKDVMTGMSLVFYGVWFSCIHCILLSWIVWPITATMVHYPP